MQNYMPHSDKKPDIYFDYIYNNEQDKIQNIEMSCPAIFFIYSGCMIVKYQNKEILAKKGECIFLQANTMASFYTKESDGQNFCSIYIGFHKSFLFEFYDNHYKKEIIKEKNDDSFIDVMKIPCTPYMQSIYTSMIPYWERKSKPEKQLMELKRKECVYCMLTSDPRFYKLLFNFIRPIRQNLFYILTKSSLNRSICN